LAIPEILARFPDFAIVIIETPIPKAQRSGIGKLNNPAQRRVECPAACFGVLYPRLNSGMRN
jgi:hypothetical protein